MSDAAPRRIIVGISGASGALLAVRLLQALQRQPRIETHLVVSAAGKLTLQHEMGLTPAALRPLVHQWHPVGDIGAPIASGSFKSHAMLVVPCAMRTLAALAHGLGDNLLTRAADVMLKERRRLVLMVRETPLNLAHLRNMVAATELGAVVFPPLPAFYNRPATIDTMVDDTIERVLQVLGIEGAAPQRWQGLR